MTEAPLSAAESEAKGHRWMEGFPPPSDCQVLFADGSFRQFPQSRWAFSHIRQFVPTKAIWRGTGPASALPSDPQPLGIVPVSLADGRRISFEEALAETYADGVVVLHRGRIVFERYYGVLEVHKPHIAMSVTKSFVGALATLLVHEGMIDPSALVASYIPELRASGFGDATVQQVLDMTTGLAYTEVYTDASSDIWKLRSAVGMAPAEPGTPPTSLYEFLTTQRKRGEHGEVFGYRTINTDVIAWIIRRTTGRMLAELLSERLWQPLGAEEDAYVTVDRLGTEYAGGGLNTTLRDLGRFGELMRCRGCFAGRQILPAAVVDEIARGGDRGKFRPAGYATLPGWSYHNQWWVSHDPNGVCMARGTHGQSIYVDPRAEVVIARYGSHPVAGNVGNDPVTLPAFRAVAAALRS